MPNYYQILELPPGASQQAIKRAYRRKVLLYHPDRNDSATARAQFLRVTEAYQALTGGPLPATKSTETTPPNSAADYFTFYARAYSPEADARRQAAKARLDRQTERHFREYQQQQASFHRSWQYRTFQWLGHAARLFFFLTGLALAVAAVVVLRTGPPLAWAVLGLPSAAAGCGLMYFSTRRYWQKARQ